MCFIVKWERDPTFCLYPPTPFPFAESSLVSLDSQRPDALARIQVWSKRLVLGCVKMLPKSGLEITQPRTFLFDHLCTDTREQSGRNPERDGGPRSGRPSRIYKSHDGCEVRGGGGHYSRVQGDPGQRPEAANR